MKYAILLMAICLSFASCQQENEPDEPTKTETITSADWKYDNGGIGDANGNISINFSTITVIPACTFDNSLRFNSTGQGIAYENLNVCSGAPATSNFTWSLSNNETQLNFSGNAVGGLSGNFRIKELSSTKLTLLKDTTVTGFGAVTAIFELKH